MLEIGNHVVEHPSSIEKHIKGCEGKFDEIISEVLKGEMREAHKIEATIFKRLMELGLLLLRLFFAHQNQGNYGRTLKTAQGIARRGKVSENSYFSIFGKVKVNRYLYHIGDESFAPLDILLNLPKRCYSYFLSEIVNLLDSKEAYREAVKFLGELFGLKLSVSALETISGESALIYEEYYKVKNSLPRPSKKEDFTVVSFDGKGVPMIKKEAKKIKGRQGKGEKRQKKKEALVGVNYTINAHERTAEEVASTLVFPERKKGTKEKRGTEKAENIRYIASVEKPKKEVMKEMKAEVKDEDFSEEPLLCLMDGSGYLWRIFEKVFKDIDKKVLIIDIIHVLEYIWLIAHIKYKEGSSEAKQYVHEKLFLVLQGKVACFIIELEKEKLSGCWKESHKKTFLKVITYLKNNKKYMKYDHYLSEGYPIGTGVVESACGHVVKNRMEISGARWGIKGAEAILRLRSLVKSNDWDDYWEFFTTQAQNNEFFSEGDISLILQQEKVA
ncbi:MAG: ISKra4 family transposase [Planctomycetes bacterium]|nr:ISKra4 family transposase [Planctomycetota bacterium]